MYKPTLIAASLFAMSNLVVAQTERDLGSHQHGAAALNIAIDDSSVFIELESPWNNVVGFEHAPNTEDQEQLVRDATALLNNPNELFAFNGTECNVAATSLESSLGGDEHDEHHDEHKDEHHDDEHKDEHHDDEHKDEHHDDEHKDEHHDDEHKDEHHDDEHKDDDHAEHSNDETHSELLLTAEFNCNDVSKLTSIDVTLLSIWTGFEDLDVQLIGPAGQAAVELNQNATSVNTKQVQ